MANIQLTDGEVCEKFKIKRTDPSFATARGISNNRPDRILCEVPACHCPHCGANFDANYAYLMSHTSFDCEGCGRLMHVEHIDQPGDEGFDGNALVTLCTHGPNGD